MTRTCLFPPRLFSQLMLTVITSSLTIGMSVVGYAFPSFGVGFFGDTIDAKVNDVLNRNSPHIDSSATVGDGVEFTSSSLFGRSYSLDIAESSFTLTISKPFPAGNFTGIFGSIVLDNIDKEITSVTFDSAASSTFSFGFPLAVDLSTPGRVVLNCTPHIRCDANTPTSALSHSFTWNVAFATDDISLKPVPEPLTIIGSATALGFGVLLKREHCKKKNKS